MSLQLKIFQNKHGVCRDKMGSDIRDVLDKYGVTKIHLGLFSVHRSLESGLSYIQGHHETKGRHCPHCGLGIYEVNSPVRILSILEGPADKVTYGCVCVHIFFKLEKKN